MKRFVLFGIVFVFVFVGTVRAETKVGFQEMRKQTKEEFRVKVQALKDEKKKQLVIKLNDQMCLVKKKRVEAWNKQLETMGQIVERLKVKNNNLSNAQIDAAETARQAAIKSVSEFSLKSCGVTVSGSDIKVGEEVKVARVALEAEVKAVQEKVKAARKLVSDAIIMVAKAKKEEVPAALRE